MRRKRVKLTIVGILLASIAVASRGDDWARFDHKTVQVIDIIDGNSLRIQTPAGRETLRLLGIDGTDAAGAWLVDHAKGRSVTLLLQSPQTRDETGRLRSFVFLDNQNVAVELVKEGLAYADRREKTVMDGVIDPAEAEARKKKRGLWSGQGPQHMPQWRQDWLRTLRH
jgi:endonuclease YncB( thermonuclease family)